MEDPIVGSREAAAGGGAETRPGSSLRASWPALVGLYLFAVAVNLVGIGWGLPGQDRGLLPPPPHGDLAQEVDRSWHVIRDPARNLSLGAPAPDEAETPAKVLRRFYLFTADADEVVAMMAIARLNPLAGRWDPGIAHYGGSFLYTLGASFKLASVARIITVRGDPSFYLSHPAAMGRIYLLGRLLVVAIGALAIPLIWILARPLYGPRIALLAAGAAAVAPAWIVWGHVMKPWSFGVPFALAGLAAGRNLIETRRPLRDAAWGGAFIGLAAGASMPYLLVFLGPLVGLALRRGDRVPRRLACGAVLAAAAGLAMLASYPSLLVNPGGTIANWSRVVGYIPSDYRLAALAAFAWGTLGSAVGLPLMAAGLVEGGWLAWRSRTAWPILVPTAAMFVATAVRTGELAGHPTFARYTLPGVLVLAMLAVGCLCRLGRALPRPVRLAPAVLVLPTLLISAGVLRNFIAGAGPASTRHLAGAWLNSLPEGTSIGVPEPLAPFRSPYFRIDRYRLVLEPHPERGGAPTDAEYFLVVGRSELPESSAFLSRYREVRRFTPPELPLGATAFASYPLADPPIVVYLRRDALPAPTAPSASRPSS